VALIVDTSILIESERRNEGVEDILARIRAAHGEIDVAISSVTVVELTHGIYRARTDADRVRRQAFAEGVFQTLVVHPVTFEIAQLAGRIEAEQAAQGISIEFEDLIIGCTALHLGFGVATRNVRHFHHIPGLKVVTV
jgi:tRNA(fMet)-specific endonuclease VapC